MRIDEYIDTLIRIVENVECCRPASPLDQYKKFKT